MQWRSYNFSFAFLTGRHEISSRKRTTFFEKIFGLDGSANACLPPQNRTDFNPGWELLRLRLHQIVRINPDDVINGFHFKPPSPRPSKRPAVCRDKVSRP